jgi:gallate decarboxylase subunit D
LSPDPLILTRNAGSADLRIEATRLGRDLLITLVGGDAHVGAVALAGPNQRADASVLSVPEHRDDVIAKEAAVRISKEFNCNCVVIVGIHVSNASADQINEIIDASFWLVDELIEAVK